MGTTEQDLLAVVDKLIADIKAKDLAAESNSQAKVASAQAASNQTATQDALALATSVVSDDLSQLQDVAKKLADGDSNT